MINGFVYAATRPHSSLSDRECTFFFSKPLYSEGYQHFYMIAKWDDADLNTAIINDIPEYCHLRGKFYNIPSYILKDIIIKCENTEWLPQNDNIKQLIMIYLAMTKFPDEGKLFYFSQDGIVKHRELRSTIPPNH